MKTFAPNLKTPSSARTVSASHPSRPLLRWRKNTLADLTKPLVQPKLIVGQREDEYEQEADRVAEEVTQTTAPTISNEPGSMAPNSGLLIQRALPRAPMPLQRRPANDENEQEEKREEDDEEKKRIQKKGLPGPSSRLTSKIFARLKTLFNRGRPLPAAERAYFESRFGHDFSQVRVHDDPESAQIAHDLHAQAFTHSQHIFFGAGQYRPDTSQGKFLLAHELTHVVQQRSEQTPAARETKPPAYRLSQADEASELEAERAARTVNSTQTAFSPFKITLHYQTSNNGVIARRAFGERPPQIEEEITVSVDDLAEWVITNWQLEPGDREGGIRRRLANLVAPLREAVLQRVRSRLSLEQWQQFNAILNEPEPAEMREPAAQRGSASQTSTTNARSASERAHSDRRVGSFLFSPEESLSPPESEATAEERRAEQETAGTAAEPETEERLSQVSQRAAEAEARLREATMEAQRAQEEPAVEAQEQEPAETELEAQPEEAAVEEPGDATAETSAAEAQPQAETVAGTAGVSAPAGETAALESSPEAEEAEAARTEERMAQARRSEPAEEELEVEEEDQESAATPESASEILAEEAEETAPEEETAPPETEPEPAASETESSPETTDTAPAAPEATEPAPPEVAATAPESEVPETPAALETGEAGGSVEPEALTAEEEPASAAAPSPANLLESGEQEAALATVSEPVPDEGGEALPSGGGSAIPIADSTPPAAPDVSQLDPAQAMASVANLPPAQLQTALGGVSAAASRSVSEQREDLSANPPQMERPSGATMTSDQAATPRAAVSANGRNTVERAAERQARPTPQPAPLPAPPASPTQAVREPQVRGDEQGQLSSAEAQRLQSSLSNLPTTDPGLQASAGTAPTVRLEGNANPEQSREQRLQLERSMNEAHAQGQREAAQPMGENEIYPEVPPETLRAQLPSSAGSQNGAATPARGAGAATAASASGEAGASDEAVSIIAQQERGEEIRAAASQAQSDMAARREEQETQVTQERERSQQEIAQLEQQNATEQATERASAQNAVREQRSQWSEAQRNLVERNRTEADHVSRQGETDIAREQTQANREAAQHVAEGDRRAGEERRRGEQEAERERRRGEEESSGVFGWLASRAKAFFNRIKEGIKAAFERARALVRQAIEAAKRLAVAAIERARQAIVNVIRTVGNALIAIGNVVLADFPGLRDRFRSAIEERVAQAEAVVNALADRLKEGVQRALDALGAALDAALGLLERGLLAAVDVMNSVVQGAINFAKSVAQALAAFAALIADIAANPLQWIRNLGASAWDGVRNHLWTAFKTAIQNWFNQKLEEVLGLGMALWNLLRNGGIQLAAIGRMAWEALKSAIPTALIQILIEKLVSLIIPAAGAVLAIIEALQAAWGTVSRIIQAFEKFFAFLKAVKSGNAGQKFAQAIAAAAIAVIDFVANWLLRRLRRPAGRVAGRLRAIAQRIMQRLRSVARRVGGALRRVGRRIRRGFRRFRARARRRFGRRRGRARDGQRSRSERERLRRERAYAGATAALNRKLTRGLSKLGIDLFAAYLRVRYRFRTMRVDKRDGEFTIEAGFSPGQSLGRGGKREAQRTAAEFKRQPGVADAVPMELLAELPETIRELATPEQIDELEDGIQAGLIAAGRPASESDVSKLLNHILDSRIIAVKGTSKLRMLYHKIYERAYGLAKNAIHHLIPLYLGGGHEPINLLELGPQLHGTIHALFRSIGTAKGMSLSFASLRARAAGGKKWVVAVIYQDGRIKYFEAKFTKKGS